MNRGRFLGFLGKIGILSLIPGLPALGAPRTGEEDRKFLNPRILDSRCAKLTRSPMIKGKRLSNTALTATLASTELESIRDLMTGRFFGNMAQDIFRDGYKPFISWKLNEEGNDTGCFFYADADPITGPDIDHCGMYITWQDDEGEVTVSVASKPGGPGELGCVGTKFGMISDCSEDCMQTCFGHCADMCDCVTDNECTSECNDQCSGTYCSGTYCSPKENISLEDLLKFQDDAFVQEILEILETTDVRTVQTELKKVIFSDEVLNMGLEHFVTNAYDSINP